MQTYHNPPTGNFPASSFITLDRDEQFKLGQLRVETITLSGDAKTYRLSGHIDNQFSERPFDYAVNSPIVPAAVKAQIQQASIDQMKAQLAGPVDARGVTQGDTRPADWGVALEGTDEITNQFVKPQADVALDAEGYVMESLPDSTAQILADIQDGVPARVLPLHQDGEWNNTSVPTAAEQRMLDAHAAQQAAPAQADPTNWGWKGATEVPPATELPGYKGFTAETASAFAQHQDTVAILNGTPGDGRDFLAGLPREAPTANQSAMVQAAITDHGGSAMDRANASWSAAMDRSNQAAGQLSQAGMGALASAIPPSARIAQAVSSEQTRMASMLRHPSHRR